MPNAVRVSVIALLLTFVAVGASYRIRSQRPGESLDRTKEGWPMLVSVRALGLITAGVTLGWLWKPEWFTWASYPIPVVARWMGIAGLAAVLHAFALFVLQGWAGR